VCATSGLPSTPSYHLHNTTRVVARTLLAARISPETTDATTIPHNPQPLQYHNCLSRYGTTVKMKDLPNIWLLKRGRDSNIEAFGIIDITVVVAIVVAIVRVEFGGVCGCARCLRTYSRREYYTQQYGTNRLPQR